MAACNARVNSHPHPHPHPHPPSSPPSIPHPHSQPRPSLPPPFFPLPSPTKWPCPPLRVPTAAYTVRRPSLHRILKSAWVWAAASLDAQLRNAAARYCHLIRVSKTAPTDLGFTVLPSRHYQPPNLWLIPHSQCSSPAAYPGQFKWLRRCVWRQK